MITIHSVLQSFAAMLFGAQLVLTLVLVKGEICPGQRGRAHKAILAVAVLWLFSALNNPLGVINSVILLGFFSQVKVSKTRYKGPVWLLNLANLCAAGLVIYQIIQQSAVISGVITVLNILLLGSALGHALLVFARSRLQVFQRLLPVIGIVGACCFAVAVLFVAQHIEARLTSTDIILICCALVLLVVAVLVWVFHIVRAQAATVWQLSFVVIVLLAAVTALNSIVMPS